MTFEIDSIQFSLGEIEIPVKEICDIYQIDYNKLKSRTGVNSVFHTELDEVEFVQKTISESTLRNPSETIILINQSMKNQIPGKVPSIFFENPEYINVNFFEVSDACTGFLSGLQLANSLITSKQTKSVDLITVEKYSQFIDMSQTKISTLFSDSVTISRIIEGDKISILSHHVTNSFKNRDNLILIDKNLSMSGIEIFDWVTSNISSHVDELLKKSGLEKCDINYWFIHQGSKIVVDSIVQSLKLSPGNYFKSSNYGNLVSGSIPMMLNQFLPFSKEKFGGKHVVLLAFGVGLSIRSVLIKLSK